MAERDFYTIADNIAYPLRTGDPRGLSPSGTLPVAGIVDAGFFFGLDGQFTAGTHVVYLYAITVASPNVTFDFRSDAPGMSGYRWLFTASVNDAFGCSIYADATPIVAGPSAPERGVAFLAIGKLSDIIALGNGVKTLTGLLRVEPALLQDGTNTFARQVTVANDARRCPPGCNSSSSSASEQTFVQTADLVGDIKFKEGYNTRIQVNTADNSIQVGASRGAGDGETCEDVVIDEGGFKTGDDCGQSCDGFIKSVNGKTTQNGKLKLIGLTGMVIVPDPINHKLVVRVEANRVCGSSSSSSV